jgi:hypothetical protein
MLAGRSRGGKTHNATETQEPKDLHDHDIVPKETI